MALTPEQRAAAEADLAVLNTWHARLGPIKQQLQFLLDFDKEVLLAEAQEQMTVLVTDVQTAATQWLEAQQE